MRIINELYRKEKKEFDILVKTYHEYLMKVLSGEIEKYVQMIDACETEKGKKDLSHVKKILFIFKGAYFNRDLYWILQITGKNDQRVFLESF